MCPQGSSSGPLVATAVIPYLPNTECLKAHALIRKTVEIQLKTSFTSCRDFGREAAKTYREVIDFTSRDSFYLEVEIWKILGKKELSILPLMKKFLKKLISTVFEIESRLKTNELVLIVTTIYKIITRHLVNLENLLDEELSDKLKQLIQKQTTYIHHPFYHRLIQQTLEKIICSDSVEDAVEKTSKSNRRQWELLPAFSEFEIKEWEEIIWNLSMKIKYKCMPHASSTICYPFIGQLISEIKKLQIDATDIEVASTILFLQKEHAFISKMSRKEFVKSVEQLKTIINNFKEQQNELFSLYNFFEKQIKESLRFSKNLDQIYNLTSEAYRKVRDLPILNPSDFKKNLDLSRQSQLPNVNLHNFLTEAVKYVLALHSSITEASLTKEVQKIFHEAISLPPLNEDDLALNIFAALLHYVDLHPLHNTIRPITLLVTISTA